MKNLISVTLTFCILIFLDSCSGSSSVEAPKQKVEGTITNVSSGVVSNAKISLFKGAKLVTQTTSLADGKFSISDLEFGTYKLKVKKTGYLEYVVDSFNVTEKTMKIPTRVKLLGTSKVSGKIINSQNGIGVSNSLVLFDSGDTILADSLAEIRIITDAYGNFSLDSLPTGTFVNAIYSDGFFRRFRRNINLISGGNEQNDITLVDKPNEGEIRIVLNWGSSPRDLDAHITGPATGGVSSRFHIYYSRKTSSDTDVTLDHDDTNSFGPETVTIANVLSGVYRYSVHNYSMQTSSGGEQIPTSPTLVEVFSSEGLISSFNPPPFTGNGNTWRVFELSKTGTRVDILPINSYIQASSSGDISSFRVTGKPDIFLSSKNF